MLMPEDFSIQNKAHTHHRVERRKKQTFKLFNSFQVSNRKQQQQQQWVP